MLTMASYLGFPVQFFERDDPREIPEEGVSFRSLSKTTKTQRKSVIAAGEIALELADLIEMEFELPLPNVLDGREHGDPEGAAIELREIWGIGEMPIPNLVGLLESEGIRVFSLSEDGKEVDAFSFWRNSTPFVLLNTRKSAERSRFDCAHELGHLVLHRHGETTGRQAEMEANAFASAFLMPRLRTKALAPHHASIRGILQGKKMWKVSAVAYAFRLHKIGVLSDYHYHSLMRKMSSSGLRTAEIDSISREGSTLLKKVFDSFRKEGTGRREIAARLGIFPRDLDDLVFGLVLTGVQGGIQASSRKAQNAGRPSHLRLVEN